MVSATVRMTAVALKWRSLAERRRDHHIELYQTGRWRHYYSELEFLAQLREAIALAERWARIAPRPDEHEPADPAALDQARMAGLLKAVEQVEPKAA